MSEFDDLLQERLEQLEDGAPLAESMAGLPPEEAELLQLAAQLREMEAPAPAAASIAAQRAAVLSAAQPAVEPRTEQAGLWAFLINFFHSPARVAGAAAVAGFILMFLTFWAGRPSSDGELVQELTKDTAVAEIPPSEETTSAADPAEPAEIAVAPGPTADPTNTTFLPVLSAALSTSPNLASLTDVQGFVEILEADGEWQAVTGPQALSAGSQIRTGALSSASLTFYDGSVATIGPDSGLTIEQLDAQRPEDGFRTVVLNQWQGESRHAVQFRNDGGSHYEVLTPDGSGIARGTKFQVSVAPGAFSRIAVTEGRVDVTGNGRTVSVTPGKLTTIPADEAPSAPAFSITGQGELSEKGETVWIIAGQTFVVNEATEISGDPQVGDTVFVWGHLAADEQNIADRIELVRRSPANQFTLTGIVTEMDETAWVVAGQTIMLTPDTEIDATIVREDKVQVRGVIGPDGTLTATSIVRLPETEGYPFAFTGVVQQVDAESWLISGVLVTIDEDTAVSPNIQPGDVVSVEGLVLADQTWLATSIELVEAGTATFSISGAVQNINPWQVAGIGFETNEQTLIDDEIEVGDLVRVNGRILPNGTWLADSITLLDEDYLLEIIFAGTVEAIDPWVVSGLPLVTNDETRLDEDIVVGDLVRVTARIREDGTWLATRIDRLSGEIGEGCVTVTAVITHIGSGTLTLSNGTSLNLDEVEVEGDLKVGSVAMIIACVAEDGSIQIEQIIVLYTPTDPPPQPTPPSDNGSSGSVTICHKPGTPAQKTMTLPQSALNGHLGHGDTRGPCP